VSSLRCDRGTVYAEFLVAFVPLFLMFLGGLQLALIAQARVVVQHAASLAARAAIVAIDDDPIFYDDGKRKLLSAEGSGEGRDKSQQLVEGLSKASAPPATEGESSGSERLNSVRNAAYLPLSAVGPSHEQVMAWFTGALGGGRHSVGQTLGDAPLLRVLTSLALYVRVASAVTFPRARYAKELRDLEQPWRDGELVHVRVTYLFPCGVPLVRAIACRSLIGMKLGDPWSALSGKEQPFEQALEELGQAEWADMQAGLYALPDERFLTLQGEAALPNQGAAYRYPSELCKTKKSASGVDCKGKK